MPAACPHSSRRAAPLGLAIRPGDPLIYSASGYTLLMDPLARAENSDANAWWEKRRKLYNIALVLAGFGAFAAYAAVLDHFSCSGPDCRGSVEDTEITLFTIMFQALGYLVAMGVANVLFGLGALSEQLFRPKNRRRWRRACFVLGVCFSVALPFLVPVLVALRLGGRQ